MREVALFVILIANSVCNIFCQNGAAGCDFSTLTYNNERGRLSNFHAPNNTMCYRFEIKSFYEAPEIVFVNHSLSDSSTLMIYEGITCDSSSGSVKHQAYLDHGERNISLDSFSTDKVYTLCISSTYKGRGSYRISYQGSYDESGCYYEVNSYNSVRSPQIVRPSTYNVNNCIQSCNHYVKKAYHHWNHDENYKSNYKWFLVDPEFDFEFISTKVSAVNGLFEVVICSQDNDQIRVLYRDSSELFQSHINYLPTRGYDNIYVGVRPLDQELIDFNLCYKVFPPGSSCIDYITEGDTLYPVATSLGSDLEGPYKEGEEIQFIYRIDTWRPIDGAWLHSIRPTWSGSWSLKMDSINLDSLIDWSLIDEQGLKTNWDWVSIDSTSHFNQLNNKFLGPAWYIRSNKVNNNALSSKLIWGENHDYSSTPGSPYLQLQFTMVVDDTLNCAEENVCDIALKANTDFETGYYFTEGCVNVAEVFSCTTVCCTNMPLVVLQDSQICDQEVVLVNVKGLDQRSGSVYIPKVLTERSVKEGDNRLFISLGNRKIEEHRLRFSFDPGAFCVDSMTIPIAIAPLPKVKLEDQDILCPGEDYLFLNKLDNENRFQSIEHSWSTIGNERNQDLLDSREYYISRVYQPTAVALELKNQYGCWMKDTGMVDLFRTEDRILKDHELCASDLDSIYVIPSFHDDCTVSVIGPGGNVTTGNNVRLANYGKYYVRTQCGSVCHIYDSFLVKEWRPLDTIYVELSTMSDIYDHTYLEMGDEYNSTRSSNTQSASCDYLKDTLFLLKEGFRTQSESNDFLIYPNPTDAEVNFCNRTKYSVMFRVIDLQGNSLVHGTVQSGKSKMLPDKLKSGVYYVFLQSKSRTSVQKLIVNE